MWMGSLSLSAWISIASVALIHSSSVLVPSNTKGTAITALCKHLGVDLSEVVAFGDGENDAEMLEAVGLGVAMKNARPKAKGTPTRSPPISTTRTVAKHLEALDM